MLRATRTGGRPVLLLDEITAALDAVTERTLHEIIGSEFLKNGHAVIMVSHRIGGLAEVRFPDEMLLFGRVDSNWSAS
ncbi:hypothetical protein QBC35DRAFT_503722 [Podospora australis]|uniref:ABC transporter n=1 Tax=Podospora australis TaxID=1536484 RepID=A0AAN7AG39_9PEZI|nr:hypothetical protein QBC35DRAFT_503722 [Podospora australis]